MKETRIDNPDILVKDSRILELDHIVTEVKQSEEWEAVQMNILEVGIERGRTEGLEEGICALIQTCQELGLSREETEQKVKEKLPACSDRVQEYMEKYWI